VRTYLLSGAKKIGEIDDPIELKKFVEDLKLVVEMGIEKLQEISNNDDYETSGNIKAARLSAEAFDAVGTELLIPKNMIDSALRKKSALLETDDLKYPPLKDEYVEKGKLTNSACRDFAQWLCIIDGGAVTKKRLENSLQTWRTKSSSNPTFNKSSLGGWIGRWKYKNQLSSAFNRPGLYTMSKDQLVEAIGSSSEEGYNLIINEINSR
jgi:hypothetical protein